MMTPAPKRPYKGSKKPYIIVGALFIYMCVMAVFNRDTLLVQHDYLLYFGTCAAELAVLVVLFFVLRRRERLKAERLDDLARAEKERRLTQEDGDARPTGKEDGK